MKTTQEISQLLRQAFQMLQEERYGEAENILAQVLPLAPRSAAAHTILAKVLLGQNRAGEAERHAREAMALDPERPEPCDALALIVGKPDRLEAGLEEFRQAAADSPGAFGANYMLGLLLVASGRHGEALEAFRQCPETNAVLMVIVQALFILEQNNETLHTISELVRRGVDAAQLHGLAGRTLFRLNRYAEAGKAFATALEKAPRQTRFRTGLAASYGFTGREPEAHRLSMEILAELPPGGRAARAPRAVVLVLWMLGCEFFSTPIASLANHSGGNTISQIPAEQITFHYLCVNHPNPVAAARALGPIDAIYNNVSNAETGEATGSHELVRQVVDALGLPVINAPEAVARTTRALNAKTLPKAADIIFPKTCEYSLTRGGLPSVEKAITQAFSFPLILRHAHTNYDENTELVRDQASLGAALRKFAARNTDQVYAIDYITEEYQPGIYRKIRCALIGGKLSPVHMEFSDYWNVHRSVEDVEKGRLMLDNPDLMDQERQFMRDAQGWLGEENVRRLMDLERALGLDFVGVDFNILSTGELVVFEANPAMNIIEKKFHDIFPYFADCWEENLIAFEEMLLSKAGKA